MSDREKREKVLKGLEYCIESVAKACPEECPYIKECYHESFMYMPMRDALKLLRKQPEIVRCRDCIHWDDDDCEIGNNPQMFAEDWYCPCGEVKQDARL